MSVMTVSRSEWDKREVLVSRATEECIQMSDKIEECFHRVLEDRQMGSMIKIDEETWLMRGSAPS